MLCTEHCIYICICICLSQLKSPDIPEHHVTAGELIETDPLLFLLTRWRTSGLPIRDTIRIGLDLLRNAKLSILSGRGPC